MSYQYNSSNRERSQDLRKQMTPEEKHLWYDFLKLLPLPVKRQKMVGSYILDFYIAEKQLAIELDGKQHRSGEGFDYDQVRDKYLNSQGIIVKRYTNQDIQERFALVREELLSMIGLSWEDMKKS